MKTTTIIEYERQLREAVTDMLDNVLKTKTGIQMIMMIQTLFILWLDSEKGYKRQSDE